MFVCHSAEQLGSRWAGGSLGRGPAVLSLRAASAADSGDGLVVWHRLVRATFGYLRHSLFVPVGFELQYIPPHEYVSFPQPAALC